MTTYKPAKNAQEQIEYLKTNKKITFNRYPRATGSRYTF